jgi:hypothetical protein
MSVTNHTSRPTKRSLFSADVFDQIATMVDRGLNAMEIAARVGCTVGTLRVKCCHYGLSLRRQAAQSRAFSPHTKLKLKLSRDVVWQLYRQARKERLSGTELATALIEVIVRDELYDAVIDRRSSSR